MSRYSKAIAAFLGILSTWGITASAENGIESSEYWGLVGLIGAYLTYQVRNTTTTQV